MNWTDLYQNDANTANGTGQVTGPVGPNQSYVTGPAQMANPAGGSAAFSWLGLVVGLVAIRVFVSIGGRVA